MRHRVYGKHLGRNRNERENLFRGVVNSLFLHGTISLSSSKAKAVKGLVDKIINQAKNKRVDLLGTFITDKSIRERLIKDILPKLGTRTSGFTSVVPIGKRPGDQTKVVRMSLIGAEKLESVKRDQEKGAPIEKKVSAAKQISRQGRTSKAVQVSRQVKPRTTSKTRSTSTKRKVTKK